MDGDLFRELTADVASGDDRVRGLRQAGHGFRVVKLTAAVARLRLCPWCDGPLYTPEGEWVCDLETLEYEICEIEPQPSHQCECNACYRALNEPWGRGRPRVHCGKPECKRSYDKLRQRQHRAVTNIA